MTPSASYTTVWAEGVTRRWESARATDASVTSAATTAPWSGANRATVTPISCMKKKTYGGVRIAPDVCSAR
jgi:hypothetical protein